MKIGLFPGSVPGQLLDLESTINQGISAETDGFDSFWSPHLSNRGFDALTALSLIGARTNRIELGTAVVPSYPRHPIALAQQAMTTQVASNGRLTLGIGPSHPRNVEDAWGLSYEKPARHIKEYLRVLRPLTENGRVQYSGDTYRVSAQLEMSEASEFPILVSALAPAMLKVAGELADGTITWMAGVESVGTHIVPRITRAATNVGKQLPRICVGLPVCVTNNRAAAFEYASRTFERYGTLAAYRRILDVESADGPADVSIIGDELEVENKLRALAECGATDFLAAIFSPGESDPHAPQRTRELLASLVGTL